MKRVIRTTTSVFAMAIINPQLNKQKSIQVEIEQRDEGSIPHVHVYLDKSRSKKNCSYVRLDRPAYLHNHDSKKMNKKQLGEFLDIMKSDWNKYYVEDANGNVKKASGYEAAVSIWVDTYGETSEFNYDEDGRLVMPDYEYLL